MSLSSFLDTLRSQRYSLLPTNSSPSSPDLLKTSSSTKKRLFQATAIGLVLLVITGYTLRSGGKNGVQKQVVDPYDQYTDPNFHSGYQSGEPLSPPEVDVGSEEPPTSSSGKSSTSNQIDTTSWGLTEEMGWRPPKVGLKDLGEVAESRYRLGFEAGEEGTREYYQRLYDFALALPMPLHSPLLSSLFYHSPPHYDAVVPSYPLSSGTRRPPTSMISYKYIHQTDKEFNLDNDLTKIWTEMNKPDGWELNFLDDNQAHEWMLKHFRKSDVSWAWDYMHRGVLKADFLRYLLPLIMGGVYSDVDTQPIRPIEQWGHNSVEYLDLSSTDGQAWKSKLSTNPAVIVGVDVDVHAYEGWENGWPRALGICQWTLSSSPSHPIFLDAVRRVVNATRVVETWENWRSAEIEKLLGEGREADAQELQNQHRDMAMNVMEWTGPGLFTDSVLSFLLARYNVTWHRLRGLNHPLRIGDVLILPITGFSPGGQPDFGAEGPDSVQANVLHNFRGSWKGDGARKK
ncbi:hypothetical protein L486_06022 [Kwoniella mangroviensis CBS 10435]|uniref:Alpha 1,6-mannosyltransferase n=1 Tax=Kwoniella mangroviensis CBS 10435 TaxID=1331196 RepID=A0A1B9IL06_9TREE|nr:uncharacterized protein I203_05730 [Kwoniella mangroviensis CBS 8507]OCF56081.1 hypothetical protein L486_06022 [Kwoniella mangroviensis CBS 10435]OCF64988.1 hypothetical protein I203_05730 [Kwoniella mangroviensis CBS 8507]